ncbi:hypothetical protein NMY22_g5604 [Coprinellus aureogranulatus]|nr:hypothetical protein NMY22_g5604 [Coprinellus aureogranulatus]
MVSKITINRNRARTGEYIGRKTTRGYKAKVKLEGIRSSRPKTATQPTPRVKGLKRPRLDRYSPDPPVPLSPAASTHAHVEQEEEQTAPSLDDNEQPPVYHPEVLERPEGKKKGVTSQEYLAEWEKDKVTSYLGRIVQTECLKAHQCSSCSADEVQWRCLECSGKPQLCTCCCRISHRLNPLHRIERWTGAHWQPAWLWQTGTVVCLGHGVEPCPKYNAPLSRLEERLVSVNDILNYEEDNSFGACPERIVIGSGELVLYVHTNGYHYLPTFPCWCSNGEDDNIQFLDRSFFPATWKQVSTVFSFDVLNQFHILKVQAHLSTEQFCRMLQGLTNSVFPGKAPDRRRELARVWMEWNYLKNLKRNGFAHVRPGERPGQGDFALLCPSCPQPGINLPTNWREKLSFEGVPFRTNVRLQPTTECLVHLSDTPFLVVTLADIEIASLERVQYGLKQFDLVLIFKDFTKPPLHINSISSAQMDDVKNWLDSVDIPMAERPVNLNWGPLMKHINENPYEFFREGGWSFLGGAPGAEEEQSSSSEEESEFEIESADAYSSESSDDGSDFDDDDSDASGSDFGDGSESDDGEDWDELERKAAKDDQKRNDPRRKNDSDDDDRPKKKAVPKGKANGKPAKGKR